MRARAEEKASAVDLVAAVEREQQQIGFELHDNICQTLAGTSMLLERIGRVVERGEPVSAKLLRELGRVLETAIDQTRSLSRQYRPAHLEGAELMKSLAELAQSTRHCSFSCEKAVFVERREIALAIYRVAQEAVKNAMQHSGADKIEIQLQQVDSQLLLQVKDNGCGFAVPTTNKGTGGIEIMEWRAAAVGGRLKVNSRVKFGTKVSLKVPVK